MKILFITTGLQLGGAERQVVNLADHLAVRGHSITIVYMTGDAIVTPTDQNIMMYPLNAKKNIRSLLGAMGRLHKILRTVKPDVVHSHMVHANIFARLLRLSIPMKKLICTAHTTNEGGRWVHIAYRLTDWLASISTNVSAAAVSEFESKGAVPANRMIPVLNGIDLSIYHGDGRSREEARRRVYPFSRSRKLILAVGRLAPEKNHISLLQAFSNIVDQYPGTELWIAGDGPLRGSLQAEIDLRQLNKKITLLGARNDIPDLLRAADIMVLPSLYEGFGLVIAEAMAAGTIVVAADSGGVKEVLGGHGLLIPPRDNKELENALKRALTLPEYEKVALGAAAQKYVADKFDMEVIVDRWLQIYQTRDFSSFFS